MFIRSDDSSSDGFGGVRPAVIATQVRLARALHGLAHAGLADEQVREPDARSAAPSSCAGPDGACRRRSSSTREPPSASAIARLQAVVVLPSSGWLLVTAMMRVDSTPLVKTSDVRSERNASPKSCGTGSVSTGTLVAAHRRHQAEERQPAGGA